MFANCVRGKGLVAVCLCSFVLLVLIYEGCTSRYCRTYEMEDYCAEFATEQYQSGTRPVWGTEMAPPIITTPSSVIGVFPFTNSTGRDGVGIEIATEIEYWLNHNEEALDRYEVVNRTQLQSVLTERQMRELDRHAREALEEFSLDYITTGHISQYSGSNVEFMLTIVDVTTTEMFFQERFSGNRGLRAAVEDAMAIFIPHEVPVQIGEEPVYSTRPSSTCAEWDERRVSPRNCLAYGERSACFVTTASGTSEPDTEVLRGYRDDVLTDSNFGRRLISLYEYYGPHIADVIESDEQLRHRGREVLASFSSSVLTNFWEIDTDETRYSRADDTEFMEENHRIIQHDLIDMLKTVVTRLDESDDLNAYVSSVTTWLESNPQAHPLILQLMSAESIDHDLCVVLEVNIRALNGPLGYPSNANTGGCEHRRSSLEKHGKP